MSADKPGGDRSLCMVQAPGLSSPVAEAMAKQKRIRSVSLQEFMDDCGGSGPSKEPAASHRRDLIMFVGEILVVGARTDDPVPLIASVVELPDSGMEYIPDSPPPDKTDAAGIVTAKLFAIPGAHKVPEEIESVPLNEVSPKGRLFATSEDVFRFCEAVAGRFAPHEVIVAGLITACMTIRGHMMLVQKTRTAPDRPLENLIGFAREWAASLPCGTIEADSAKAVDALAREAWLTASMKNELACLLRLLFEKKTVGPADAAAGAALRGILESQKNAKQKGRDIIAELRRMITA
ncbi:MAG: hypothetical protein ABIJ56_03685 [Pseudomonadota bacterium]